MHTDDLIAIPEQLLSFFQNLNCLVALFGYWVLIGFNVTAGSFL